MEVYRVNNVNGQLVVHNLNANVCILSFEVTSGQVEADLYSSRHECSELVGHGSCPPIGATFEKTVLIVF